LEVQLAILLSSIFLEILFLLLPANNINVVNNLEDFPDHNTLKYITEGITESSLNSFKMGVAVEDRLVPLVLEKMCGLYLSLVVDFFVRFCASFLIQRISLQLK